MKKSKLLILALIGLLLATGMVLAGCRESCHGGGTCEIKNGEGSYCTNAAFDSYYTGNGWHSSDFSYGCAETQRTQSCCSPDYR